MNNKAMTNLSDIERGLIESIRDSAVKMKYRGKKLDQNLHRVLESSRTYESPVRALRIIDEIYDRAANSKTSYLSSVANNGHDPISELKREVKKNTFYVKYGVGENSDLKTLYDVAEKVLLRGHHVAVEQRIPGFVKARHDVSRMRGYAKTRL